MEKPQIIDKFPAKLTLDKGNYFWCQCAKSAKNPFCDGSHRETSFKPVKFIVEQKQEIYLCSCKQTSKAPFCDGTHNTL